MSTLALVSALTQTGLVKSTTLFDFYEELAVTEKELSEFDLAASETNFPVGFGGVSGAKWLVVRSNKPLNVRVNGISNPLIPIGNTLILVDSAGGYTSLHLSNPSSTEAVHGEVLIAS